MNLHVFETRDFSLALLQTLLFDPCTTEVLILKVKKVNSQHISM